MSLVVAVMIMLVAGAASGQAGQAPAAPVPAGWREVIERDSALGLEGRHKERIAILEGWVKRHPRFPDAHARLGGAYESVGRDLLPRAATPAPPEAVKYLELAATHFRRALDLGGDVNRDITIRALADLLDGPVSLRRPQERAAFVQEVTVRFPSEPRAHVERLRWQIENGKLDDAVAAFAAARAAIPPTADARVALVEGIWRDIAGLAAGAASSRLADQASLIIDEALKTEPDHRYGLMQKEEILRAQAALATDPARAKALLAEADRVRARLRKRG